MFGRRRGVWFGAGAEMFMFCSAKSRKPFAFFSEDDCHPTLHSFTNNGWQLRLLEKTWQQLIL